MNDKLHSRIREALVQAGHTNPRTGEASVRSLTRELELNNSRVSRYLHQGSRMQLDARQAVADAIGLSLSELDSLVTGEALETYSPPVEANRLNYRERALINDLIHLLAERHENGKEGEDHEDSPTPITSGDELAKRRDLTQSEIETLDHAAAPEVPDIRPDQDIP